MTPPGLRKADSARMKFCDLVPFGFAVRGWSVGTKVATSSEFDSGISWSRDTTMRIIVWSYCRFCVLLVRGVHIKFQPIALYCIIIQLRESIFPIRVRRGLNSTSAENSHVTDLRFVSILIDTGLIRTIYEYLENVLCWEAQKVEGTNRH